MRISSKVYSERFSRVAVLLALVAALWIMCPVSRAFAQETAEKDKAPVVEGKVSDANGAPVVDVALRLEPEEKGPSLTTSSHASATTDEKGGYVLVAPASGRYSLRASKSGLRTLLVKDIALARGETRRMDLVLDVPPSDDLTAVPQTRSGQSAVPSVEFSDEPNFTVAGITDRSNMGLHGSDANVRTSDALAKETAALKSAEESSTTSRAGDAHRRAGDAREKSGDPVGAVNEYAAAVKLDPSEENYFAWGAELLLHRAGPAAVQGFAKGAELHPKSPRLRAGLGAAYYADGQYNEAAAQMCKASDLSPADPQPYLFLGKMEKAAADPLPCSEEKLARFAAEQSENALANYYFGFVLWKKARKTQDAVGFAAAENYLQKAVELDSSLGDAYLQLGTLYNARGRKDAALAAFQQAVAASPKLSAAHYQLSLAYRRGGDAAKADQEMKIYDELRRSEDAQLERERRELRQFVTILKHNQPSAPH